MSKAAPGRADLLDKEPKALHTNFVRYIKEQTGYDADPKSVQLAVVLRMDFQKSDLNQKELAARRQAAVAKVTTREQGRATKAAAKSNGTAAKKAPAKAAGKPAGRAGAAPAKKAPAKKVPAKKAGLSVVREGATPAAF